MYTLLFLFFAALAVFLIIRGQKKRNIPVIVFSVIVGLLTLLSYWFMDFWGEKLWFYQLGYNERFWTVWLTKIGLFIGSLLVGGLFVYILTYSLIQKWQKTIRYVAVLISALISGLWMFPNWEIILKYIFRISTDITEPILNMQTGFYLFVYPLMEMIYGTLLTLSIIAFLASVIASFRTVDVNNTFALREDAS